MKAILLLSAAWFLTAMSAEAAARAWKTADGAKTIEAEFVSAKDGEVTIRRVSDRKIFTIPLATLSEGDRKWVADTLAAEEETSAKIRQGKEKAEVKFTEYPDGDHGISGRVYADTEMHEWLFGKTR